MEENYVDSLDGMKRKISTTIIVDINTIMTSTIATSLSSRLIKPKRDSFSSI